MIEVLDATLDPDYLHGILEEALAELKLDTKMVLKSLYPRGYRVGQQPETDRRLKFIDLIMKKQELEAIAANPESLPGDADRAQMELFELEELTRELSNDSRPGG